MTTIAEIESRLEKAEKGPWSFDEITYIFDSQSRMIAQTRGHGAKMNEVANGQLIANAPSDIKFLVGKVEELELQWAVEKKVVEKLEQELILARSVAENYRDYARSPLGGTVDELPWETLTAGKE